MTIPLVTVVVAIVIAVTGERSRDTPAVVAQERELATGGQRRLVRVRHARPLILKHVKQTSQSQHVSHARLLVLKHVRQTSQSRQTDVTITSNRRHSHSTSQLSKILVRCDVNGGGLTWALIF